MDQTPTTTFIQRFFKFVIENTVVGGIIAGIIVACVIAIVAKLCWPKFKKRVLFFKPSMQRTREYLGQTKSYIKPSHLGARPLMAYIAKISVGHLIGGRGKEIGNKIPIKEYIMLLKYSLDYEDLNDITFIAQTSPELWGDPDIYLHKKTMEKDTKIDNRNLIQQEVWDYFNEQAKLKHNKSYIKMRRYIVCKNNIYINREKDNRIKKFEKEHERGKIDLIFLDEDDPVIKNEINNDIAFFRDKKGDGWAIESPDINRPEVQQSIMKGDENIFIRVHLIIDKSTFECSCTTLLTKIIPKGNPFYENLSNKFSDVDMKQFSIIFE